MADPVTLSARHLVFLQQFAGRVYNDLIPLLEEMERDLIARLRGRPDNELLQQTLDDTRRLMQAAWASYNGQLLQVASDFTVSETDFSGRFLGSVTTSNVNVALPTPEAVFSAVTSEPLTVTNEGGQKILESFIRDWTEADITRVNSIITSGIATGLNRNDLTNRIAGAVNISRKNARALVRTTLNHVSSTARDQVYRENDDVVIGYTIVATLDRRTSRICRPLDGLEFRWGDSPLLRPPFHAGCRTSTSPLLRPEFALFDAGATRRSEDGPVDADLSYFGWLKQQPPQFIDSVIGPVRGKLLRDGGITAEQFRELSTDELFQPITLEEMRQRDIALGLGAFSQAGIESPNGN